MFKTVSWIQNKHRDMAYICDSMWHWHSTVGLFLPQIPLRHVGDSSSSSAGVGVYFWGTKATSLGCPFAAMLRGHRMLEVATYSTSQEGKPGWKCPGQQLQTPAAEDSGSCPTQHPLPTLPLLLLLPPTGATMPLRSPITVKGVTKGVAFPDRRLPGETTEPGSQQGGEGRGPPSQPEAN